MKNLYIYGHSDDCHEVDSDFGLRDEFYSDAMLNTIRIHWDYNSDWNINLSGETPSCWIVKKISGTSDFVHIQIPDAAKVTLRPYVDPEEMDEDDRPGYLMDYIASWTKDHGITDITRFQEKFQVDSFQEDVENFAEEVIKMANRYAEEEDEE